MSEQDRRHKKYRVTKKDRGAGFWVLNLPNGMVTPWGIVGDGVTFAPAPEWLERINQRKLRRRRRLVTVEQNELMQAKYAEG